MLGCIIEQSKNFSNEFSIKNNVYQHFINLIFTFIIPYIVISARVNITNYRKLYWLVFGIYILCQRNKGLEVNKS